MAFTTFNELQALINARPVTGDNMLLYSPTGATYQGVYCDPKIDRSTLPEGYYAYDIRHDDDGCGIFCQLCHNVVIVNNAGSFVTCDEIPELKEPDSFVMFKIDPEEWSMSHSDPNEPCPKNSDTDWDYSFVGDMMHE